MGCSRKAVRKALNSSKVVLRGEPELLSLATFPGMAQQFCFGGSNLRTRAITSLKADSLSWGLRKFR